MKLNEFFGKPHKLDKDLSKKSNEQSMNDDLFWFMVDHDRLHKDYVMPLAKKIKHDHSKNTLDKQRIVELFGPMVDKGCMEYYNNRKMQGNPKTLFPKELRKEMCEKMYDHFREDIIKDNYQLGQ